MNECLFETTEQNKQKTAQFQNGQYTIAISAFFGKKGGGTSTEGASIEEPKAVPLPDFFSFLQLKIASFAAF